MKSFDLRQFRVITLEDIENAVKAGAKEIVVQARAILTPSAKDACTARGIAVKGGCCDDGACGCGTKAASSAGPSATEWDKILNSPEAEKIKAEIVDVGRKLWMRQYVDGNGGNISYRIAENAACVRTITSRPYPTRSTKRKARAPASTPAPSCLATRPVTEPGSPGSVPSPSVRLQPEAART
jgi:L-fuculose-phosphate aldolase